MNKYRNQKTTIDNITFDSKREGVRYQQLKMLERAGKIANLQRQVSFELLPGVKIKGARKASPPWRYFADFTYTDTANGMMVIEDVKGFETDIFKAKRHAMKAIHNIDISIIK